MNTLRILMNKFYLVDDKISYFKELKNTNKSYILLNIETKFQTELLENIVESELLDLLRFMDPDEITDILQLLPLKKQNRILRKLNSKLKKKVDFLLKFSAKTAAGIMSLNYIIIPNNLPYSQIIKKIDSHMHLKKEEPCILVIDEENHFLGELKLSTLLIHKKSHLNMHVKTIPSIKYNENQEEVIDIFKKNDHEKVVVLDEGNIILGIIHARDIFKVIEDEHTQDFYGLAGVHREEDISDGIFQKVHYRLIWLLINLFTAFIAAFIVSRFETTLSKYVILAAFMPIIAGMGGNAGTQTTAILIRGMALKKIDSKLIKKILKNEVITGIINGTIIGLIVGFIAYIYEANILFGLVVALSLFINLFIASFFGTLIPVILKALGFDPASSSNVFVTTTTDVFGFFIFLSLASILLI